MDVSILNSVQAPVSLGSPAAAKVPLPRGHAARRSIGSPGLWQRPSGTPWESLSGHYTGALLSDLTVMSVRVRTQLPDNDGGVLEAA